MKSRDFNNSGTEIIVIAHNIRSILNLGSIIRSAECFGIGKVFTSGWTPSIDHGLPHIRTKLKQQLHKTALGAEDIVDISYSDDIKKLINQLKADGFQIVGLEQSIESIELPAFVASPKTALLLGEEVDGIDPQLMNMCDKLIEIPMFGQKESLNVSVATGIALYEIASKNNS